MDWSEGSVLAVPMAEVQDGEDIWRAPNPTGTGALVVAQDYGAQSADQSSRTIMVRTVNENGISNWEGPFNIPQSTEPLEHLEWNQGWPSQGYIAKADVLDDNTHFNAENPEGWTLEECARDYGDSYACENKTPHEVQIREVSQAGNGEWSAFTVPMEPPE